MAWPQKIPSMFPLIKTPVEEVQRSAMAVAVK
jgi:hypothetical protein